MSFTTEVIHSQKLACSRHITEIHVLRAFVDNAFHDDLLQTATSCLAMHRLLDFRSSTAQTGSASWPATLVLRYVRHTLHWQLF